MYNGQWQGKDKQGLGVYRYPGGGRYEGEWRNNLKEGRGVYTFPKVTAAEAAAALTSIVVYSLFYVWGLQLVVHRVLGFTRVMAWAERGAGGQAMLFGAASGELALHTVLSLLENLRTTQMHHATRSLAFCCLVFCLFSKLGSFAQHYAVTEW